LGLAANNRHERNSRRDQRLCLSKSSLATCLHQIKSLPEMISFVSHFIRYRFTCFLLLGGTAASVNLRMMHFLVNIFTWGTPVWKNRANTNSMEVSLLSGFIVYRTCVWGDEGERFHTKIGNQLLRYHGAPVSVSLVRFLILFPRLDWAGLHHLTNALNGIPVGCIINHFISAKFVFAANAENVSAFDRTLLPNFRSADWEQVPFMTLRLPVNLGTIEPSNVN
jgi:putative flippase GtrA